MAIKLKKKGSSGPSWLLSGADKTTAYEKEEAKAEAAKAEYGKMFRFFVKQDEETAVTFLDGDLDADGVLDAPSFYQHTCYLNGKWRNFICTEPGESCPLCASDNRNSLVGVLTVIDHTEWVDKTGTKHSNERKLFVFTRTTQKKLQKYATKHGGLTGCTFEVARTGDKSPRVGTDFDFVEKNDLSALAEEYGAANAVPANYKEELVFHTKSELLAMGVGVAVKEVGSEQVDNSDLKDVGDEL